MNEKISIIVPIYNKEQYIRNFINSVKQQTYSNYELILVNDGSTDNSIQVATDELKNTNIDYKIINKENGGQSSARNAGIDASKGDWIVIPDSDDILQNDYLEIMMSGINKTKAQIGICELEYVSENDIFKQSARTNDFDVNNGKKYFKAFILHQIQIGPYSLIINRKLLKDKEILFNEKSRYSEEFIFITDLLYNSEKVVHIKEKIYNYCLREGSVSTGASPDKILNGYSEIEKYSEKYKKKTDKYSKIYNKYALPRWIIATARFSSGYLQYNEYNYLIKKLKAKKEIRKLYTFPNLKTRMAAIIFELSPFLFYKISKRGRKN